MLIILYSCDIKKKGLADIHCVTYGMYSTFIYIYKV